VLPFLQKQCDIVPYKIVKDPNYAFVPAYGLKSVECAVCDVSNVSGIALLYGAGTASCEFRSLSITGPVVSRHRIADEIPRNALEPVCVFYYWCSIYPLEIC
jgi:hypothetical protein